MQLLLSLASLALAIGTRISVRSHTGASTTSSRIGPVGEPWQMGMKYACMQKWKAGGFRSEGKYVDEFCLVDLDKAHLLASLHLQFAETLDKCVSKKKGSHKMRLCAVKGEKPDGRLSYNTRTYVPKSCFRESPTERAYPVIEGAATEELCSFMAKSHSIQSQGQFGQAIPKEDKKIAALPASACPGGVSFITDIEGDLDWFQNIVGISKALEWSGDPTDGMPGKHLALKEGACFVFGGDLFDRGPGDIRLARELVHLKEEFPDRVFLLVANRDLNKLRLASELSDACLGLPANKCTNAVYDTSKADSDPLVSKLNLVDRVKWILKYTLSAGKTFEERRKELAVLNGGDDVDDLETAQSFRDMVTPPDGIIFRFLEKGQLGIRIGETLFVPGSIPPDALLFVPSLDLRYTDKEGKKDAVPGTYLPSDASLDTWLEQLNRFESDAMAAYKEKPIWETPLDPFGGESLLCYQSPSCVVSKAVVTESLYNRGTVKDSWGESAQYGKVADFLKKHGVKQFCTGGKPTGHMPLVTKVEEITVIMADTSYSDDSFYDVFIQRDGKFLVEGELHSDEEDGTKVSFSSADVDAGLIGKKSPDGWWLQGKTENGYHLFKQEGRQFNYEIWNLEADLEKLADLDDVDGSDRINSLPPHLAALALSILQDQKPKEEQSILVVDDAATATTSATTTSTTTSAARKMKRTPATRKVKRTQKQTGSLIGRFLKGAFVAGVLLTSGLNAGPLNGGVVHGDGPMPLVNMHANNTSYLGGHGTQPLVNFGGHGTQPLGNFHVNNTSHFPLGGMDSFANNTSHFPLGGINSYANNSSHFPLAEMTSYANNTSQVANFRGHLEAAASSTYSDWSNVNHDIDSCGDNPSCMLQSWTTAVDNMPEPRPKVLIQDFAQTVESVVSAADQAGRDMPAESAAAVGLESANTMIETLANKAYSYFASEPQTAAGPFIDPEYPPPLEGGVDKWSSKDTSFAPGSWKRATEWRAEWKSLASEGAPLLEGASASDVRQGGLGDCWFLAGMASVAENNVEALDSIFVTKNYNLEGRYELRLFLNGEWKHVVVDDYLPGKSNSPGKEAGGNARSSSGRGKLWVALLEKAYAKVFQGYGNIEGGWGNVAIRNISGQPVEYIDTSSKSLRASFAVGSDAVGSEQAAAKTNWKQWAVKRGMPSFLQRAFAGSVEPAVAKMRASSLSNSDVVRRLKSKVAATANVEMKPSKPGAKPGYHAFSILDAKETEGHVFVKLRNPWGHQGPDVLNKYDPKKSWGHDSDMWKTEEGGRIIEALGGKLVEAHEGVFWLEWNDFLDIFRGISVAHDTQLVKQQKVGVKRSLTRREVSGGWFKEGEVHEMDPIELTVDSSQAGQTLTVALGNQRKEGVPIQAKDNSHLQAAVEFQENGVWKEVTRADLVGEVYYKKNDLYLRVPNLQAGNYRVVAKAGWEGMKSTDTVFTQLYYTSGSEAEQVQKLRTLVHSQAISGGVIPE